MLRCQRATHPRLLYVGNALLGERRERLLDELGVGPLVAGSRHGDAATPGGGADGRREGLTPRGDGAARGRDLALGQHRGEVLEVGERGRGG